MTSHAGRLYVVAATVVAFFLAWAVVAAHPWTTAKATRDPRLVALAQREHRLRTDARLVQKVVDRRFSDYRRRFAAYKDRAGQAAGSSSQRRVERPRLRPCTPRRPPRSSSGGGVRVVTLPPLVITRTS